MVRSLRTANSASLAVLMGSVSSQNGSPAATSRPVDSSRIAERTRDPEGDVKRRASMAAASGIGANPRYRCRLYLVALRLLASSPPDDGGVFWAFFANAAIKIIHDSTCNGRGFMRMIDCPVCKYRSLMGMSFGGCIPIAPLFSDFNFL